ncbi:chaperone protein dnaJ C76, chloroplastic isoform X1 [Selaginella moellendorffii]|uniref:chaperone protein dnaJ C76, chloroplastic isoform X1 n=1 Tax=Selaginella moellendorffii TaxID=88036 RepID=UPI000D1CBDA0|nr:chaperone protein dnaJ C76, chloroplastic isoform X1 [Selaginella moellendorffii]|eukprot:XP_024533550.1 chaperone protein dnaJ C76, chloroplastic isoform X1 [Selaginella moellendorffii]
MAMALAFTSGLNLAPGMAIDSSLVRARQGTRPRPSRFKCRAHAGRSSSGSTGKSYYGYDLYELLGVENSAPQPEIKKAYRWLQKKCHPDVAGELGHDMSILLNEAYAILSDPTSRGSYDAVRFSFFFSFLEDMSFSSLFSQVRAEWIQFEGFTGEPLYSRWMGPASEEKAVFVDEVRCIGCLKCALIASNTFAVEKRYGRARAVSQWGDSKPVIDDAIRACPVDCISWVDRGKLAALEYLMAKQPRYTVNIEPENSPGERAIDVFKSAEKFLKKNAEFQSEKENPAQKYRTAATDAIQARAGRWWHFFVGKSYSSSDDFDHARSSQGAIVPLSWFAKDVYNQAFRGSLFAQGKMKALYEAVTQQRESSYAQAEEYWEPLSNVTTPIENSSSTSTTPATRVDAATKTPPRIHRPSEKQQKLFMMRQAVPVAVSLAAALVVQFQTVSSSQISQAAASSGAAHSDRFSSVLQDLASTPGMQPLLAGIVWYVLTSVACSCVALFVDDSQT